MRGTKRIIMWLRGFTARRAVESELDEEMRFHLDMEAQKLARRGLAADGRDAGHDSPSAAWSSTRRRCVRGAASVGSNGWRSICGSPLASFAKPPALPPPRS